MTGELEVQLQSTDAAILANQMSIYYAGSAESYSMVHKFNHLPEQFDHNELITRLETLAH